MSADVDNPYESPSLAVSEEASAPPICFNARERRAIERFIWVNQIVAGCVITISVVMPVAYSIGFASGVSGISFAELVRFSAIMAVVLAIGIFQANKNIYAITVTGLFGRFDPSVFIFSDPPGADFVGWRFPPSVSPMLDPTSYSSLAAHLGHDDSLVLAAARRRLASDCQSEIHRRESSIVCALWRG